MSETKKQEQALDKETQVQASEFQNVQLAMCWRYEPELWFAMLEKEFAAHDVRSDAVKCAAVFRHLDAQTMKFVADLIANPPTEDSYGQLKKALLERLVESEETRMRKLLTGLELQNRKPSELLRAMARRAGTNVNTSVLQTLWSQRLPSEIQEILTVVEGFPLEKLAALADKTIELTDRAEAAAVTGTPSATSPSAERDLHSAIVELTKKLGRMETHARDGGHSSKAKKRHRWWFRIWSRKKSKKQKDNPAERFQHVHIDIIGPLPIVQGYAYCLTMIDRSTRWPEATPLKNTTAETVTEALYSTWISRFGSPCTITTEKRSQFDSIVFNTLLEITGTTQIRTTTDPASNELIERWHRSLKAAITSQQNQDWVATLPTVLLGLRTSFKHDMKATAAGTVCGVNFRLPREFFLEEDEEYIDQDIFIKKLSKQIKNIRPVPIGQRTKSKPIVHGSLHSCTHVFVRVGGNKKYLEAPYEGPFPVVERHSDKVFKVNYKGQNSNISVERLKPAFLAVEPEF